MTTTTDFIREMRELCEKATPGPWEAILWPNGEWEMRAPDGPLDTAFGNVCSTEVLPKPGREDECFANASLLQDARTALPEVLDRLERLERVRVAAAWRTEIDALMNYMRDEKLPGAFARMTTAQFNKAVDELFLIHKNANENLCKALREAEGD